MRPANVCSAGIPISELPTASAMALVVETCIITEPVKSAPTGVAMIMVYRPVSGLIPASRAVAMLSGMLSIANVKTGDEVRADGLAVDGQALLKI